MLMGTITRSLLGSKLATRVSLLFLAGAFVPVAIILALATRESLLAQQNHTESDLGAWADAYAKIIPLRVSEAQYALDMIARPDNPISNLTSGPTPPHFAGSVRFIPNTETGRSFDQATQLPPLDSKELSELSRGSILLRPGTSAHGETQLQLIKQLRDGGLVVAQLDLEKLLPSVIPDNAQSCLLVGVQAIRCAPAFDGIIAASTKFRKATSERLHWNSNTAPFSAALRRVSLAAPVASLPWTIMVAKPDAGMLAQLMETGVSILLAASLTLLVVVAISLIHIRRTLLPLRQLLEATHQVAHQDFSHSVSANSPDELGELARSFNGMSARLDNQFKILKMLAELDRSILSRSDIDRTANAVLEKLPEVIRIAAAAIVISDPTTGRVIRTYVRANDGGVKSTRLHSSSQIAITTGMRVTLEHLQKRLDELGTLASWPSAPELHTTFIPVQTEIGLSGLFVLARFPEPTWEESDEIASRDIAGRIEVAVAAMQKEHQLFVQTRFDHLTRLPNRLLFSDRLVQEITRTTRNGHMLALLYIDLDFFKQVNDTLGHGAGDQVLRNVATRLRASVRDSDTVARLSGDEFAVILTDLIHVRDAGQLARSIIQRLSEPFTIDTQQCFLCASIGITVYPTDGQDPESLLSNADIAMYRAKEAGKGRHVFYEERMNRETHHLANLDRELRLAVEHNQFVLHFQPQVDLLTGNICGVEALLRWQHPERGLLAPAYFMSHAESSGLIEPLGELVLVKACEHYNRWRMLGIAPPRISINASPRQFKRPDFSQFVENTLTSTGIAPNNLELEITETVLMEESELPRVNIDKLAACGVRIAIDDFGTGYSSLSYLKRLPFHLLKIDRSFVRDVTTDEDARTIAATIIAMAHNLRKDVLAEGVDHVDQLTFLRGEHCDQVQGYLISQPLPDDEFVRFLRAYEPTLVSARRHRQSASAEHTSNMSDSYAGPG